MNNFPSDNNENNGKKELCANCGFANVEGFRYCVRCGAPKGKSSDGPIDQLSQTLYGPPPVLYGPPPFLSKTNTCKKCGKEWESDPDDDNKLCPECRNRRFRFFKRKK